MLIRDERIAAVGSAGRVRAAARPGALVVPLEVIDAHCHLCDVGYLASGADCSQPAAPDIPAIIGRLRLRLPDTGGVMGDRRGTSQLGVSPQRAMRTPAERR